MTRTFWSAWWLASIALLPSLSLAQEVLSAELLWETDTLLTTVESAIYDPITDVIYTTNIDGHFMRKDGQGSVSTVALDGRVLDAEWIRGLHAPTGTGIHEGHLFVTDIDAIVEIDIEAGAVVQRYPVPGAVALNDIVIDAQGTVYASDTGGNTVYALHNGVLRTVASDIDTPNGLLAQDGRLLVTQWTLQTVGWMDLETEAVSTLAQGIEGPDGLEAIGDGTFLASGFNGQIYHLQADGSKTLILDTAGDGIRAADIEYIPAKRLLLVPTMQRNTLRAYRLADG
ncbi:MAG: ATP/GTP-binding protein [Bacteroidota bacterium]